MHQKGTGQSWAVRDEADVDGRGLLTGVRDGHD
jgi:hypothetical protein